ncbi:type III-B CRISPR module RAMP protein Cmr1 [Persephonella sp.]
MSKKEVTVTFRTITPLWTGDAWQNNREIRLSSLMGSLRFWFSFYWKVIKNGNTENLDKNGVPKENLAELEDPKVNKTFKEILKGKILKTDSFDKALDKTLDELGLSVPSRIFGCTGWKSRIKLEIEEFEEEYLNFDNLEFRFPLNRLQQSKEKNTKQLNTNFWIKKNLFKDNINTPLSIFKNVKIKLTTTNYWWNNYLKDFFDFFKDKIILAGGKRSFGFGFVNIVIDEYDSTSYTSWENYLKIEKISQVHHRHRENKKVLGFNFKYYLRKKENKKFRPINFGTQGQASKVYVSHLTENDNKNIYLLVLNSPFDRTKDIPNKVIEKYKKFLQELIQNSKGESNG